MRALDKLRHLLATTASQEPVDLQFYTGLPAVLEDLERRIRTAQRRVEPRDLQLEAVRRFFQSGQLPTLKDARLVAFGLALRPAPTQRCLMEDAVRFPVVLEQIGAYAAQPSQFRRCYQGLVRSYFDYDGGGRDVPAVGQHNWLQLRDFLGRHVGGLRTGPVNPDWIACAERHRAVFSDQPCAAYGDELLRGRDETVREVRDQLGIGDASWFTRELVLSQIQRACALDHKAFQAYIDRLLALLADNEVLRDRGLQLLLERCATVPQMPQHYALRQFSVEAWGNPWLPSNEHQWGGVSTAAREMVGDWLKHELIELFFSKLAKDGTADARRVRFWQRYVPSISRMTFALGRHAREDRSRDAVEVRKKISGLTVPLEDSDPFKNAFIMTMGGLVAVEFSAESNAFYGYVDGELPFDVRRPVRAAPKDSENCLKNSRRTLWLSHQDLVLGYERWEDRFAAELLHKFGLKPGDTGVRRVPAVSHRPAAAPSGASQVVMASPAPSPSVAKSAPAPAPRPVARPAPATAPAPAPTSRPASRPAAGAVAAAPPYSEAALRALAERLAAPVVDMRSKGGALWLYAGDTVELRRLMPQWNFQFKAGRGWWREAD
jgi:hypothetical protein